MVPNCSPKAVLSVDIPISRVFEGSVPHTLCEQHFFVSALSLSLKMCLLTQHRHVGNISVFFLESLCMSLILLPVCGLVAPFAVGAGFTCSVPGAREAAREAPLLGC